MAQKAQIVKDLKNAISESEQWRKNYLNQTDDRDKYSKAVAKIIAAIEQAVPSDHTYNRQADIQFQRIQKREKPSDRIYGLGDLKGIAEAALDMVSKPAYKINPKPKMKVENSMLDELLLLITDLDAMEKKWLKLGDNSSCNNKIDLWKERATRVIAKHFGNAKASRFKNKTVWRSPSGRHPDDFKKASDSYRQYIVDLIDEAKYADIQIPQQAGKQAVINSASAKIFIIHGHDERNLLTLEKKLKKLTLESLIMKDAAPRGMQIFIDKFERLASQASYAIALLTKDDLVMIKEEITNGQTIQYFQARPNVLFELGWFLAKLGRQKILILSQEDTKIPTDLQGIEVLLFQSKVEEVYEKLQDFLAESGLIKISKQ